MIAKPLLVVNPKSGGGATGRAFDRIHKTVERTLGAVDVVMTERSGHGIDLAKGGATLGRELVIAVGGDGTIHEVVNGIMSARAEGDHRASLGIIAQGTGGDFRKSLAMEHRLDKYIDAIASGRERKIDVGRFQGGGKEVHYFINILSVGMGGLVDTYVAKGSRALGGKAAYFGASFKALVNAKLGNVICRVTNDGATEEHRIRSFMIAVCNGQTFGGGMHVAPMAKVDDGTFELVALGPTSKLGFALSSSSIYSGGHMKQPSTVHLRGQTFELTLANDDVSDVYLIDCDGEPMGELPVRIEVMPSALTLRG